VVWFLYAYNIKTMAIRKNRRMQKGGLWGFEWLENMFKPKDGSNKEQAQVPTGQGQVPTGQGQVPTGQGQVPTEPAQVPVGQGRAPAEPYGPSTRTSMGGKFRGGKSNRRNKSKKSRRTKRR